MSDIGSDEKNKLAQKWEMSEMAFAVYAAQRHVPLGGTFELTPRCNFSCKMCYVRLDKSQMDSIGRERTAHEWMSIAKEALAAGTLHLLITGGEPLLRPDFEEIYTALANMGFIITLNTNASLMTLELQKLFQKLPPTATNVTLYGASPETYQSVCGSSKGFSKTLEGLKMLMDIPTVLEVRTTFIKNNMHELDALRTIANRYTKRFAINVEVNDSVRGAVSDAVSCRLAPSQMFDITEANAEYYRMLNPKNDMILEKNMETDHFVKAKELGFDYPPKILTCLAAKSMYWITWDGRMIPCGSFTSPYTLPFEEGFISAWNRLPTLFEEIKLPSECTDCKYANGKCPNCPGNLQAETGFLDRISPYLCEVAKERAKRIKKWSR